MGDVLLEPNHPRPAHVAARRFGVVIVVVAFEGGELSNLTILEPRNAHEIQDR
jgi:hypothetical protein